MKRVLLLLSFLFFALYSANPLLGAAENVLDPVLDIAGEELQRGVGYYVLSIIRGAGGGGLILVKNWNDSICPLDVAQSSSDLNNGLPLTFWPLDKDDVVRASADLHMIKFSTATICPQSDVWEVAHYDNSINLVTTGGAGGSVFNRFRIEKHNVSPSLPVYKFVHCVGRRVCDNVGIHRENGIRRLGVSLGLQPHLVVFKKAEACQNRKVTFRFTS
uniref:Putative miraculin n=2 Tax=Davidia involucrata TaxID=16924 RepID=A0A5B7B324_DAVIN